MKRKSFSEHIYNIFRKDIGRKAMALLFAMILWIYLDGQLVSDQNRYLQVRVVEGRSEFDRERGYVDSDTFFIVISKELMLTREIETGRVSLKISGPKDSIPEKLIGKIFFDERTMGGDLQREKLIRLNRDQFDVLGDRERINITEFFKPKEIKVALAMRGKATITLGDDNLLVNGMELLDMNIDFPIRYNPTDITLTGPAHEIEKIAANPKILKLQAINLTKRVQDMQTDLPLSRDWQDKKVTIQGNSDLVSVKVLFDEPEDVLVVKDVEINVRFNERFLTPGERAKIVLEARLGHEQEEMVDITFKGPKPSIQELREKDLEDLRRLIWLYIDISSEESSFDEFYNGMKSTLVSLEMMIDEHFKARYQSVVIEKPDDDIRFLKKDE